MMKRLAWYGHRVLLAVSLSLIIAVPLLGMAGPAFGGGPPAGQGGGGRDTAAVGKVVQPLLQTYAQNAIFGSPGDNSPDSIRQAERFAQRHTPTIVNALVPPRATGTEAQ